MATKIQCRHKGCDQPFRSKGVSTVGDPLFEVPEIELAYMAGLIDGDGCIRIGHVGPNKMTYYPTVEVGMTHRGTIEWLQSRWRSGSIKLNNHTMVSRLSGWKKQWIVRIHGKRARLLCSLVLKFLKAKRRQAELVCSFPCDARTGGITQQIRATRLRLFKAMRKLNLRGPSQFPKERK